MDKTKQEADVTQQLDYEFAMNELSVMKRLLDEMLGPDDLRIYKRNRMNHPHDSVMFFDEAYTMASHEDESTTCALSVCNNNSGLKQCSGCMSTMYCCKDHQREDWSRHKKTCK